MTDSSRGFDEELRARLASLARALRSFKITLKKLGIPPVTAKQRNIRFKSMENVTKSTEKPTKIPEGTEKKPKGHHQRAQRATRVPLGCKIDDKRTPKGAQRAPKGDQNGPKMAQKSA